MLDTTEEIAHWGQPKWSRIESIQSLESLSTMISLQFSPLAFHNSLPPVLFFLYTVSLFFINIFLSLMSKKEDDDFTPHYTCKLIRHLVMTIQLLPLPSKNLEKQLLSLFPPHPPNYWKLYMSRPKFKRVHNMRKELSRKRLQEGFFFFFFFFFSHDKNI